jgi:hypothetical protein
MAPLTLVIGNKNYSSWSLRPWILMKHLGLAFAMLERAVYLNFIKNTEVHASLLFSIWRD